MAHGGAHLLGFAVLMVIGVPGSFLRGPSFDCERILPCCRYCALVPAVTEAPQLLSTRSTAASWYRGKHSKNSKIRHRTP